MMAVHLHYERVWELKTWDGFLIPKPFTRAVLVLSPLIHVPRDLDSVGSENARVAVEQAMVEGAEQSLAFPIQRTTMHSGSRNG